MREEANQWRENQANNIEETACNCIKSWTTMRKAFLLRFGKPKTRAAAVQGLTHLKQAQGERVSTYHDRVLGALDKLTKDRMDTRCITPDHKEGFADCRDLFETAIFLNGLKGEIRYQTELELEKEVDTRAKVIVEKATRAEIAGSSRDTVPGQKIAAVEIVTREEHPMETLKAELAEIKRAINSPQIVAAVDQKKTWSKKPEQDKPMGERRPMLC